MKTRKTLLLAILSLCALLTGGCSNKMKSEIASKAIGDTFSFGQYNNKPIEWEVLDKNENSMLLISKYVLDYLPLFDTSSEITTENYQNACWEESTIRKWLNENFYNNAFNEQEQEILMISNNANENGFWTEYSETSVKHILQTTIDNGGVIDFEETEDKVFLLSLEEIENYYGIDETENKFSFSSPNAVAKDLSGEDSPWWLRSVRCTITKLQDGSIYQVSASPCMIGSEGQVNTSFGTDNWSYELGVRPAIRIDIGK